MNNNIICETNFPNLKLLKRGKVRDIYEVGDHLLIVATDRISAFDVVMKEGIPYKGKVLSQISKFWFDFTPSYIKHHFVTMNVSEYPIVCQPYKDILDGRSMLVLKAKPLEIECIVRGYISGSGWKEYQKNRSICGISLPNNLVESSKLPKPIFTPSTKAEMGIHDENITFELASKIVGKEVAEKVMELSLMIYEKAHGYALERGIIIADTKMEFGIYNGEVILIDEVLTPDSSRFWSFSTYQPGRSQESFDKQPLRDYLDSLSWNKQPPPPRLPEEIISITSRKYLEALKALTD